MCRANRIRYAGYAENFFMYWAKRNRCARQKGKDVQDKLEKMCLANRKRCAGQKENDMQGK
jgi:hypothetical protein